MMLDQKVNLAFFFRREPQRCAAVSSASKLPVTWFSTGIPLPVSWQQQGKNQEVAPVERLPEWSHRNAAFMRRIGQFLQMLNRAQRMFVNRVR